MTMTTSSLPLLRLPEMGPLTQATLFHDFSSVEQIREPIDWEREIPVIINHRLASVAERVIGDLGLEAPDRVVTELQNAVFAWVQSTCTASKHATDDLICLQKEQIDFVVTKGPGIAQCARRRSERPFTDIDIFVATEDFARTLSLLEGVGYAEEDRNLLPWPSLNRYCREAVNLRSPSGGSIDVHHRIPPWYWGANIDFHDVRDRAKSMVVPGGGELPCASPTDNFLVSALHIVSDKNSPGSNLMAWRDFLLLAHAADPWDVVAQARRAHLCGWIDWIIGALPADVRPLPLAGVLAREDHRIPGQHRLAMLIPPGIGSRHVIGQVFRLPTANAMLYLAGMAWPSADFLRVKIGESGHRRSAWWRSGMLGLNDHLRVDSQPSSHESDTVSSS
jgi:hypothetical protein